MDLSFKQELEENPGESFAKMVGKNPVEGDNVLLIGIPFQRGQVEQGVGLELAPKIVSRDLRSNPYVGFDFKLNICDLLQLQCFDESKNNEMEKYFEVLEEKIKGICQNKRQRVK